VSGGWRSASFAASACFLIGPFPGYASLVGDAADSVTFFAGSVLFTAGGALQVSLAFPERGSPHGGRAAFWVAAVQSAGTLFFNLTTFRAMHTALSSSGYDKLVWRPDAFGSTCFLISGAIAYHASARHGWRPARSGSGWWEPSVNLLGCILFGISAVAGYVSAHDGIADRPGGGELEHVTGSDVLPGLRPVHIAHRPHVEIDTAAASAQAGARGCA
jgi:hypothetical protein